MVVNRLQKGLINSPIVPRGSRPNCQKKKQFNSNTLPFFNSDRDFHSENNNVSQEYTYIIKIKKKVKKTLLSFILKLETALWAMPDVVICHLFFQLT
jgi:hypothetical protein